MKEFFASLMGPNAQGRTNAFGSNPDTLSLAGLLRLQGVPEKDAYVQAAGINRQREQSELERLKYEQQQQAMMRAAEILQSGGTLSDLLMAGVNPQSAAAIYEANKPNPLTNTFAGAGGVRYEAVQNPETGSVEARPLAGQVMKEPVRLSAGELRINAMKLKELANDARTAEKELRLLEDAQEAFNELDRAQGTGTLTGAGSIYSKLAPNFADNIALTKAGQAAKQKVDKINSQLYQNRVQGAGARATDSFKEEVKKGLPSYQLQPEARNSVLQTKARENLEMLARSRFFSEWVKRNNKDLNGAEDAFNAYITNAPLLSPDGRINKEILKDIPNVVKEFVDDLEGTPSLNMPQADMTDLLLEERSVPNNSSDEGYTDEELIRIFRGE